MPTNSAQPRPARMPALLRQPKWQQLLADAVSRPAELFELLGLDPAQLPAAMAASSAFPLRVPRSFIARMRHGDPRDPLLLQVLPVASELASVEGYGVDPVGDMDSRAAAGLLHKYEGRALAIATGACAVHCRYCFRRHFPYANESALGGGWQQIVDHLRTDASVNEVILSGGDPLSLSDRRLTQLTDLLQTVPHIRRLRIHTRYPIVLPERIDSGLLAWLAALPLQKVVVIHANHERELDDSVARACGDLVAAGATLLNQSVLLKDINDSVDALAALSERLMAIQVLPYYLHVLDRVAGAAHFDVAESTAQILHEGLLTRLPGYLVPRLVREIAGRASKTPLV